MPDEVNETQTWADPDPFNDDLSGDDVELMEEIRGHARVLVREDVDLTGWALRVRRMRDLLQELLGKPIDHPDIGSIRHDD